MTWYPEFEDDFRPTTAKGARKIALFSKTNAVALPTINCISTTAPSNPMFRRKLS